MADPAHQGAHVPRGVYLGINEFSFVSEGDDDIASDMVGNINKYKTRHELIFPLNKAISDQ